jgi:ABC-type branched-subunit amino acid transport system substrate-binding protein
MIQYKVWKRLFAAFLIVAGCFSCGLMKDRVTEPEAPDVRLFHSAEEKYHQKNYTKALSLYEEHSRKFSDSELAPQVLLRMGQIQLESQKYAQARVFFQRVIDQYPASPSAREAGIEKLRILYFTGKYQEVIAGADKVSASELSAELSLKFHLVVGDSYLALKAPLKAYHEFLSAQKSASPRDSGQMMSRFKVVIPLLTIQDIRFELKRLGNDPPAGDLMFELGRRFIADGKKDEAMPVFATFLEKFPDHEYAAQARQIMAHIQEPAKAPVEEKVIGCLLPLSGKYEAFGQQALKGVELALTVFARQQESTSINILIKDTASQSDTAEQMIAEFKEKNAAAILGPVAASEAAAAKAQELGIPIVTLTQKSNITSIGEYVFRNFLTPEMQVKALVAYAMGTLHISRFAILYPDESYGTAFMNLFQNEAIRSGAAITRVETYRPNENDFEVPVKKLIGYNDLKIRDDSVAPPVPVDSEMPAEESDPDQEVGKDGEGKRMANVDFDAVFIPDAPEKAGLIIPLFAYYGVRNIYLLGTNLWHSEKMIQMTASQIQGAVIPEGFFGNAASEDVSQFVAEFEKEYGYQPGFIEAVSYDTAMILFQLAAEPDVKTPEDMKNKLLTMPPYPGVTGMTSFSRTGEAVKDIYLLKIISGRFAEIYHK